MAILFVTSLLAFPYYALSTPISPLSDAFSFFNASGILDPVSSVSWTESGERAAACSTCDFISYGNDAVETEWTHRFTPDLYFEIDDESGAISDFIHIETSLNLRYEFWGDLDGAPCPNCESLAHVIQRLFPSVTRTATFVEPTVVDLTSYLTGAVTRGLDRGVRVRL
jgi:hypothetical protein